MAPPSGRRLLAVASAALVTIGAMILALPNASPPLGSAGWTYVEPPPASPATPAAIGSRTPSPSLADASRPPAGPTVGPVHEHQVSRIAVAVAGVDLPVVRAPPSESFPPCDVAETMREFGQPGQGRVVFVYAHARTGMFLGLLTSSVQGNDPLMGATIDAYTDDGLRYRYQVAEVHRGVPFTSFRIALDLAGEALVLQTSETSSPTGSKLMVVARPAGVDRVSVAEARPTPHPRPCH